jgi:hypothetical protein
VKLSTTAFGAHDRMTVGGIQGLSEALRSQGKEEEAKALLWEAPSKREA